MRYLLLLFFLLPNSLMAYENQFYWQASVTKDNQDTATYSNLKMHTGRHPTYDFENDEWGCILHPKVETDKPGRFREVGYISCEYKSNPRITSTGYGYCTKFKDQSLFVYAGSIRLENPKGKLYIDLFCSDKPF